MEQKNLSVRSPCVFDFVIVQFHFAATAGYTKNTY